MRSLSSLPRSLPLPCTASSGFCDTGTSTSFCAPTRAERLEAQRRDRCARARGSCTSSSLDDLGRAGLLLFRSALGSRTRLHAGLSRFLASSQDIDKRKREGRKDELQDDDDDEGVQVFPGRLNPRCQKARGPRLIGGDGNYRALEAAPTWVPLSSRPSSSHQANPAVHPPSTDSVLHEGRRITKAERAVLEGGPLVWRVEGERRKQEVWRGEVGLHAASGGRDTKSRRADG